MFNSKFIKFPIRKFYIKTMIKLYQPIVAQWCYMATQISINISSGTGLLPLSHLYAIEYWPRLSELRLGHICAMEYWTRLAEIYIGRISMLWNADPGSLNYTWVTFLCYGILTQSLWIVAGSHFYSMEYWPRLFELWLGHISMLWNIDSGSLNYSWVTFLCYVILTQALWIIAGSHFYAMEYRPRLSES